VIVRIAGTSKKTSGLETANEARNLPFISSHCLSELSGGSFACLHAANQQRGFLCGYSELREAAIERCLQSYAGSKEQRDQVCPAPFPYAEVFSPWVGAFSKRVRQEPLVLPGPSSC
jgi:hypothetical protein